VKKSQKKVEQKVEQQTATQRASAPPEKPSRAPISRHQRKCSICRHPLRGHIEEEFLEWHSCRNIVRDYQIDERALYRHAHALGLFHRRANTVRFALGHIVEQAANVEVTANSIVSAVRVFAHITDDGHWVNPPKQIIVRDETQNAVSNRQSLPIRKASNF
jgi:hypothetical protein